MHYVYMVVCKDGRLYTGYTNALLARIEAHNQGKGAKFTRGRTPVRLIYFETFEKKGDALSREASIKKLPRNKKIQLIKEKFKPQSRKTNGCNSCKNADICNETAEYVHSLNDHNSKDQTIKKRP